MNYYLLTGASKGIGAALAAELLGQGHSLYCLSRTMNEGLDKQAVDGGFSLSYTLGDLTQTGAGAAWVQYCLSEITPQAGDSVCLIHNAGLLGPVSPVGAEINTAAIEACMRVNLISLMEMAQVFVKETQTWQVDKQLLGISSGAGRGPRAAWSIYCASKAGVDMYLSVLAEEQADQPYPIRVVSLAPGVVETGMQEFLRQQPASTFPSVDRFISLKENDQLWTPELAAQKMIKLLNRPDFGKEVLLDLRKV